MRTGNAPAGDLAERLVAELTGGDLATNAQKGWDVLLPDVTRIQVKARVVVDPLSKGERQVSAFRSWDFEWVAFVLFDGMYHVRRAALVPKPTVEITATFVRYTSSYRVFATDDLLEQGEDWTSKLSGLPLWSMNGEERNAA